MGKHTRSWCEFILNARMYSSPMRIGLYLGLKLHLHTCFEYASRECTDTRARINLGYSSKISCAVLVPEELVISLRIPSKHVVKSGHYRPASKTPSERRFAGGPIVQGRRRVFKSGPAEEIIECRRHERGESTREDSPSL